jgi:hypothetical protein
VADLGKSKSISDVAGRESPAVEVDFRALLSGVVGRISGR